MPSLTKPIKVPDSGRAQRLHVVAGASSVQGTKRERNEDNQYISPERDLFIVADGMGGHAAGEVASKFAVDVLSHELARFPHDQPQDEVERRVKAALERAHCLILDSAAEHKEYRGAATTVVFGLLLDHRLYITGVGDSRAYLIRGESIKRLTTDDTVPDVLFRTGHISAEEAQHHQMRNLLMTALGLKEFDSKKEEIQALDVYFGDRYLLASDGVTDAVPEDKLLSIIAQNDNPQHAAELLTQEAIANGAGDDVTSVVFYVETDLADLPPTETSSTFWQRLTSLFRSGRG